MRIYLSENIFPSFTDDKLVFSEKDIEFGNWNDNRKASVNVPISDVAFYPIFV